MSHILGQNIRATLVAPLGATTNIMWSHYFTSTSQIPIILYQCGPWIEIYSTGSSNHIMKNKFGRWSKEILWLERQKTNFVFFRNPPFFLCFFLKTFKIKISTVRQARIYQSHQKHSSDMSPHLPWKKKQNKRKQLKELLDPCVWFYFFFFFFCNGYFPPSFPPFFLSLISRRSAPGIVIFITFDVWFWPFSFSFLLSELKLQEKKTIQNLKNSKLHFSFPFNSFFLSKRDPSMILNARKCNEFICLLLSFDSLFIWFEFKFLSFHFLLFHSFLSFILSFLQCSICLFWMIVSRIYCPMLLQLGRRLFRIALEKEN